jgi:transposase-like protein
VKVNESLVGKSKNQRGRIRNSTWILGSIDRNTGECFVVSVPSRQAVTVFPITLQWVNPGTTIMTDQWREYNGLVDQGFGHQTVNHSINFVNPITGAHNTQNIESMWKSMKQKFNRMYGTRVHLRHTYLLEFMWRRLDTGFALHNILTHIADITRQHGLNNQALLPKVS